MSAEYWNYVTSGFVPFLTFCVACVMGVFCIGLAAYVVLYMWNGGSEPEFFRSKSVKIKSDKFADPAESERKKTATSGCPHQKQDDEKKRKEQAEYKKQQERLRKQQEAELQQRIEIAHKQQRLNAEEKQQEAEQKCQKDKAKQKKIACEEYWRKALPEYGKFGEYNDLNDPKGTARKAIAMKILKISNSDFTRAELVKQYRQLIKDFLPKNDRQITRKKEVLEKACHELLNWAI